MVLRGIREVGLEAFSMVNIFDDQSSQSLMDASDCLYKEENMVFYSGFYLEHREGFKI